MAGLELSTTKPNTRVMVRVMVRVKVRVRNLIFVAECVLVHWGGHHPWWRVRHPVPWTRALPHLLRVEARIRVKLARVRIRG